MLSTNLPQLRVLTGQHSSHSSRGEIRNDSRRFRWRPTSRGDVGRRLNASIHIGPLSGPTPSGPAERQTVLTPSTSRAWLPICIGGRSGPARWRGARRLVEDRFRGKVDFSQQPMPSATSVRRRGQGAQNGGRRRRCPDVTAQFCCSLGPGCFVDTPPVAAMVPAFRPMM